MTRSSSTSPKCRRSRASPACARGCSRIERRSGAAGPQATSGGLPLPAGQWSRSRCWTKTPSCGPSPGRRARARAQVAGRALAPRVPGPAAYGLGPMPSCFATGSWLPNAPQRRPGDPRAPLHGRGGERTPGADRAGLALAARERATGSPMPRRTRRSQVPRRPSGGGDPRPQRRGRLLEVRRMPARAPGARDRRPRHRARPDRLGDPRGPWSISAGSSTSRHGSRSGTTSRRATAGGSRWSERRRRDGGAPDGRDV